MNETEKLNRIGAEVMDYLIDPSSRDLQDDTQFVYSPGKVTRDGVGPDPVLWKAKVLRAA